MITIVYGLLASLGLGASDYGFGVLARLRGIVPVLLASQFIAAIILVSAAAVSGQIGFEHLWLVVPAAICRSVGSFALFRGLSIGPISIVAPITGISGVIPLTAGILGGDLLSSLQLAGAAACLIGVALLASSSPETPTSAEPQSKRGIAFGFLAMLGLGGEIVFLSRYTDYAEPFQAAANLQIAMVVLLVLGAASAGALSRPNAIANIGKSLRDPVLIGVTAVQASAAACVALAVTHGQVSTAGILISTYPAVTILLARTLLKERMDTRGGLGALLALAGVACIAS